MSNEAGDRIPNIEDDLTGQVDRELYPIDSAGGANISPDDLRVDPAQLFIQAMEQTRMAICVTDPHQADNPIVYVNQAFAAMTGYGQDESFGRNCKFLQGRDTDPQAVERIRTICGEQSVGVVEILNYRKDGTPFWNSLHIGPIYDEAGKLTHFYGSQWDVTEMRAERELSDLHRQVARELQHRTDNLFSVVGAIVRLSRRGADDADELVEKVIGRFDALARAHRASVNDDMAVDMGTLVEAIMKPYATEKADRVTLDGPTIELSAQLVTPLGLAIHELATNALKYGALARQSGTVDVSWHADGDGLAVTWTENGVAHAGIGEVDGSGTGSRMIEGVLRGANATIEREWRPDGLHATLRLPLDPTP